MLFIYLPNISIIKLLHVFELNPFVPKTKQVLYIFGVLCYTSSQLYILFDTSVEMNKKKTT